MRLDAEPEVAETADRSLGAQLHVLSRSERMSSIAWSR